MTADQSPGDSTEQLSIGSSLRRAREDRSFNLSYVATQTLLHEKVITALESDDYEQLPSPVFVSGYIRTYAKVLEIDPEPLIVEYKKTTMPSQAEPVAKHAVRRKTLFARSANKQLVVSTILVVAVLLGLTSSWWLQTEIEPLVTLVTEDVPGIESLIEVDENFQISLGDISPDNESTLIPNQENASSQQEIDDQASSIDQDSSVAEHEDNQERIVSGDVQDPVKITVTFLEESWTEIFDVRKRRLLHGLIKPGAVRVVYGEAPFNVFFGNAQGVEVKINDKPFNHIQYARKNKTARFLVEDGNS